MPIPIQFNEIELLKFGPKRPFLEIKEFKTPEDVEIRLYYIWGICFLKRSKLLVCQF